MVGVPVPDLPNMAPTAQVYDASARVGELVELSGVDSADPDGDALSFAWTLRRAPDESLAVLDLDGDVVARFVPDRVGLYAVDLVVSDGVFSSATATAIVQVDGYAAPVALAGPDQTVVIGHTVFLDGRSSSDHEGRPLSYRWEVAGRPSESTAVVVRADSARARFVADALGDFEVTLLVHNGVVRSVPDRVRITVVEAAADAWRNGVFDPNEVYFRVLSGGYCNRNMILQYRQPDVAIAALPCDVLENLAMVAPDGTLIYKLETTREQSLREFRCDGCPAWAPNPAAPFAFPEPTQQEDPVLPTPPCDADVLGMELQGFLVGPDGSRVHTCGGVWYTEAGERIAEGITPLRLGFDGLLLLSTGEREHALFDIEAGVERPITGLPPCPRLVARAGPESGFLMALECGLAELWSVSRDGAASRVGVYAPLPDGEWGVSPGQLTADGALVQFVYSHVEFGDTVIERVIGRPFELVYSPETALGERLSLRVTQLLGGP